MHKQLEDLAQACKLLTDQVLVLGEVEVVAEATLVRMFRLHPRDQELLRLQDKEQLHHQDLELYHLSLVGHQSK